MSTPLFQKHEELIAKSGVRNVFTPSAPIKYESFLFGREKEVGRIVGQLSSPGGHVVLFGDRGVGKTSLSNIVAKSCVAIFGEKNVFRYRCAPRDTFRDLFAGMLAAAGINVLITEMNRSNEQAGKAELSAVVAKADISEKKTTSEKLTPAHQAASPSWIVKTLGGGKALLIVDEVDVLGDKAVLHDLAILVKQLSDEESDFKLCLVGVARNVQELLAGHKSAGRALAEIKLGRLTDRELRRIVDEGANRLSLKFADEVQLEIGNLSAGYPYFTHLIALKCAEDAITEGRARVEKTHLPRALELTAENTESSLRQTYLEAIAYDHESLSAHLLYAAARCRETEFAWSEQWLVFQALFTERPTLAQVTRAMEELAVGETRILMVVKRNIFRFSDPRMPSYIHVAVRAQETKSN